MKAVVYERYGGPDVLHLRDVAMPAPRDGEILIELRATTVTSADARLRAMNVPPGFGLLARLAFGVWRPRKRVLGMEFAGVVASVGPNVHEFAIGDAVFGMNDRTMGCHAEYAIVPARLASAKPANCTFEEAAALSFGGTTALDFFRRGKLAAGERLLVNGASGSVGTAAIQLAKHLGAHVSAVCSTANLELVRSLGADEVIDYTQEDFTRNGETYDVVMDTVGTAPPSRSRASLRPGGRLLLVLAGFTDTVGAVWIGLTSDVRVVAGPAQSRQEDLRMLGELAAAGKYRPVIDRTFGLDRIADAHTHVDGGHKKGNVVITVAPSRTSERLVDLARQ